MKIFNLIRRVERVAKGVRSSLGGYARIMKLRCRGGTQYTRKFVTDMKLDQGRRMVAGRKVTRFALKIRKYREKFNKARKGLTRVACT